MDALVGDLLTVLDTYLLDTVRYAGYSLGGRVGWQFLVDAPDRVSRAVLGGIPDGRPLARLKIDQARAYAEDGSPIDDRVTQNYVTLAERVPGNDLRVLVALAEGMRLGDSDPDPANPPQQSVLFATGSGTRSSSVRGSWRRQHPRRVHRDPRSAPLQHPWLAGVPRGGGGLLHAGVSAAGPISARHPIARRAPRAGR